MIFSSRWFFQKINQWIQLYNYDTSCWLVFIRFLEEIEDTKKTFQNYLTFSNVLPLHFAPSKKLIPTFDKLFWLVTVKEDVLVQIYLSLLHRRWWFRKQIMSFSQNSNFKSMYYFYRELWFILVWPEPYNSITLYYC